MNLTFNLGAVTAYADAVEAGYEGTREQFAKDQANFAKNAAQVAENLQESKDVLEAAKGDIRTEAAGQIENVRAVGAGEQQAVREVAEEKKREISDVGAVLYGMPQTLTEDEQGQARGNIYAAGAIADTVSGDIVTVSDSARSPLLGLRVFGKSTQDGTPTPETPIELVSVNNPTVNVCGKNLIPYPYYNTTNTVNGVTFTDIGDGSINFKGTTTAGLNFIFVKDYALKAGTYILSAEGMRTNGSLMLYDSNEKVLLAELIPGITEVAFTAHKDYAKVRIYLNEGDVGRELTGSIKPMLRSANTMDGAYEPYTHQSLSLSTPNGLAGIPVSSGGNYTDENGQEWICDEIDLARGLYVQRVESVVFDGTEDWKLYTNDDAVNQFYVYMSGILYISGSSGAMCPHYRAIALSDRRFNYNTIYMTDRGVGINTRECTTVEEWKTLLAERPITALYIIATPIETPIDAETLAAYRALYTNHPNTTIYNDSSAGLELTYAADTKTYIDNKFAALSAAILNN